MIDSSDKERIDISKKELMLMMDEDELKGVPVMVLANKQDLVDAMNDKEIIEAMGLNNI